MSHPNPDPPNPNPNPPALTTQQCHQCHCTLSLDPSQLATIRKQQGTNVLSSTPCTSTSPPQPSLQCVYVSCPVRSAQLFACAECSAIAQCRHCLMPLCSACRSELKVLGCAYCPSFVCSQQCYGALLQRYFVALEQFGVSRTADESMHFFRKLLLAPHLHAALAYLSEDSVPFHVCEGCKRQNCGCVDWVSCVHCRKYYCAQCEGKALTECALEECRCVTCCRGEQWARNCDFCNRFGECGLIFCTKGHCKRHIIIDTQDDGAFAEMNLSVPDEKEKEHAEIDADADTDAKDVKNVKDEHDDSKSLTQQD